MPCLVGAHLSVQLIGNRLFLIDPLVVSSDTEALECLDVGFSRSTCQLPGDAIDCEIHARDVGIGGGVID